MRKRTPTRDEMVNALQECAAEAGRLPTQKDYENWQRTSTYDGRKPSRTTIVNHLGGSWRAALATAFPEAI